MNTLKVGDKAANFEAKDQDGNLIKLSDEILGVSADTEKKQSNFRNKFGFPYPLLADVDKEVIDSFGVWGSKKFMGRTYDGIHRITFVIDAEGIISHVIDKVKTKNHSAQILEL